MKEMKLFDFFVDYLEAKKRETEEVDYDSDKGLSIKKIKGKKADLYKKQIDPRGTEVVWNFCREVFGYKILGILRNKVSRKITLPKIKTYEIEIESMISDALENGESVTEFTEQSFFNYSIVSSGSAVAITLAADFENIQNTIQDIREKIDSEEEPGLPFPKSIDELIEGDLKKGYQVTLINFLIPNVIIGNSDTHFGNFIKDPTKKTIYQIDPGRAFGEAEIEKSPWQKYNVTFNKILTNIFSDEKNVLKTGFSNRFKIERTRSVYRRRSSSGEDNFYRDPFIKKQEQKNTYKKLETPREAHKISDFRDDFKKIILKNLTFWENKLTDGLLETILKEIESEFQKIYDRLDVLRKELEDKITERYEKELDFICYQLTRAMQTTKEKCKRLVEDNERLENLIYKLKKDNKHKTLVRELENFEDQKTIRDLNDQDVYDNYRYEKKKFKEAEKKILDKTRVFYEEAQKTIRYLLSTTR